MPLAALFIGGVLPAQLGSLIRKRAGYMKGIMKRINHSDMTHYFIALLTRKKTERENLIKQLPISYIKSCNKFMKENSIAAQIYRFKPIKEWRKARKDFEENGYPWLTKKY